MVAIPLVTWLGALSTATIVALVVIAALFGGPGSSASEALRPAIAMRSGLSLERTNAWGEATDRIGNVLGPAGAGLAVAALGLMSSFWIAAGLLMTGGLLAAFSIGAIGGALAHTAAGPRLPRRPTLIAGFLAVSISFTCMAML